MRTFQLAVFVLCAIGGLSATLAQSEVERLVAESKPAVQAEIDTTIRTFLSSDRTESKIKSNWKGYRQIAKLKELAVSDDELVKQLAIYAIVEQDEENQQVSKSLMVLRLLNLKPTVPIRILAPYLNSENAQLRDFAQHWFTGHDICAEGPSALQTLNYGDYVEYVRGQYIRNQEIPGAFIDYIYERTPGRALLVFYHSAGIGDTRSQLIELHKQRGANHQKGQMDGRSDEFEAQLAEWNKEMAALQGKDPQPVRPVPPPVAKSLPDATPRHLESKPPREILLSEHIISNAIWLKQHGFDERFEKALPEAREQLLQLAAREQWWVRLYVVKMMRQHQELREPEVLDKLSRDSGTAHIGPKK